ncbi:hypothetical protein RR46_02596 [Papilio xuthus]|uniref:Uncharacterized protein n=1 Tax=Papilio xuthus TaxID=66420 RepID=A0A194Q287_PAPXU|nr:hypothetical protein RR46_02596 [Papilio xuthus]
MYRDRWKYAGFVLSFAFVWTSSVLRLARLCGWSCTADVAGVPSVERRARAARNYSGPHQARSLNTPQHVGHEKSCQFAGCPSQRTCDKLHLSSSRGHTVLVDDRRAPRPYDVVGGRSQAQSVQPDAVPPPHTPAHSLLAGN